MSRTNLERATHAEFVCETYGQLVGMTLRAEGESLLSDLLADLLHLAVRLDIDPDRVVRVGQMHFTEEQEESR